MACVLLLRWLCANGDVAVARTDIHDQIVSEELMQIDNVLCVTPILFFILLCPLEDCSFSHSNNEEWAVSISYVVFCYLFNLVPFELNSVF